MKSAVLEKPAASGRLDADRLRALVLVRIASAADGLDQVALAADLAPFVAHRCRRPMAGAGRARGWSSADGGLAGDSPGRMQVSAAGADAARRFFLGLKGALPRSWSELQRVRLLAKALGLEREPAKRAQSPRSGPTGCARRSCRRPTG